MSGGGNHAKNSRNQPFPTLSQQSSVNAASSSSSGHPPPPSYASSSSAPNFSLPATISTETLVAELNKKATLQSAPLSQKAKAIRIPNRPDYGQLGRKIQVRVNHFQLQVANNAIHHYKVSFSQKIISKELCRNIINQLVKMYRESRLDNRIPAYDGRNNLFTAGPLPFTSEVFVVNLTDENRGSSSDSDMKKHDRKFKVTIEFVSKTDLYSLTQFLQGMSLDSPSLGQRPLGGGAEYYRGFHQMGLSLNIDVASRAFYEPILVTEFVSKHLNLDLSKLTTLSDQDRVKIEKVLKGIKVKLSLGGKIRRFKVTGLSREPLGVLTFFRDVTRSTKNVLEYLSQKYNIMVNYSLLPALQVGRDDSRPTYFPMELCQIEAGQRYSQILSEKQVIALLRATFQGPSQRENDIKNIVKQNHLNTDKVVKEVAINVTEELALVNARVLPPPMLKYYGSGEESKFSPSIGQWNMIKKKLYEASEVKFWSCICFSHEVSPIIFCNRLIGMCRAIGMTFNPDPLVPITTRSPSQIESDLAEINQKCKEEIDKTKQEGRLQLLIVILPDLKGSYDIIKRVCETQLGIISQCCQPKKAANPSQQNLESLALKINVKSGGCNTVLNDALIEKRIDLVTDKPTIIFGADVTHYKPGEDSCPSIAAVVASMDWPCVTKYKGIVSAQDSREEIIQDLFIKTEHPPPKGVQFGGMIRESLLAFHKSTKLMPDRIIFYRDGVGEGQFSQVLLQEMNAIRDACHSIDPLYRPTVTFVVVTKRHHTRLFPVNKEETDNSENIMPGTVVDTSICHPREFDFYLNSHAGNLGTSIPAHYHVLYDENEFTADQLQSLTNNLCYTYARCTRSVSIVPPVYYAHLLSFRARSYMSGVDNGLALPPIKNDVKDKMFYC